MTPLTTASERDSGASRTPRRLWRSRRMTSSSSRWSSGAGVSLSNGWTAMVRTWDGRPPPAKPYFVTQPETTSASASALQVPDRRIERRDGIGPLNDEGQRTAGTLLTIQHSLIRAAIDPFAEPATIHALEARQRVTAEAHAPVYRRPNVGPDGRTVNANDGIALRG